MANTRHRKKWGWARTKNIPHAHHPAYYKYTSNNNDDIMYVTFTHHAEVEITKDNITIKVDTIKLNENIDPKERGIAKSYVFPIVYIGKRSALGKKIDGMEIHQSDKEDLKRLFETLPKEVITRISNSKK